MKQLIFLVLLFCSLALKADAKCQTQLKISAKVAWSNSAKISNADTPNYCLIYIYRKDDLENFFSSYKLHVGDSIIRKMKNDSKYIVKIYKEGIIKIWATAAQTSAVKLNVEFGKEYFINCSLASDLYVPRPRIKIIDPVIGKKEFQSTEGFNSKEVD